MHTLSPLSLGMNVFVLVGVAFERNSSWEALEWGEEEEEEEGRAIKKSSCLISFAVDKRRRKEEEEEKKGEEEEEEEEKEKEAPEELKAGFSHQPDTHAKKPINLFPRDKTCFSTLLLSNVTSHFFVILPFLPLSLSGSGFLGPHVKLIWTLLTYIRSI